MSARLEVLDIRTWHNSYEWCACLREYDDGAHIASGKTQRDAVNALLDYYELDNGELHE
jgi:hypothetical protein